MAEQAQLDHTVINVRFDMDRAQGLFADLGFFLTDRGYHSLGSINHLMMLGTDYLELIGLPPGMENPRADVAEAPFGINGLVFKTPDVDETFAHLQALDMAGDPPKAFTRPVKLADGEADAAFRTVAVRPGIFPGGRVYYCEHGTPELVWRPEWQNHGNGAQSISEFVVASTDHQQEAENFARLLHSKVDGAGDSLGVAYKGGHISVMTPAAYGERYGALASPMAGRSSFFGALVFRSDSLDKIRGIVAGMANPVPTIDEADRVVVRQPAFDSVLEFIV
ncbi:MAG: VOC family protein [Alphaproteobacteria bacterium]|nr:VOC family protein [Alphaproteobacteria bacterium]